MSKISNALIEPIEFIKRVGGRMKGWHARRKKGTGQPRRRRPAVCIKGLGIGRYRISEGGKGVHHHLQHPRANRERTVVSRDERGTER